MACTPSNGEVDFFFFTPCVCAGPRTIADDGGVDAAVLFARQSQRSFFVSRTEPYCAAQFLIVVSPLKAAFFLIFFSAFGTINWPLLLRGGSKSMADEATGDVWTLVSW